MSSGGEPHVFGDEVFARGFPLHRACRDGDVGSLVSLLQHFTNRVHLNVEDSCYGWTPIHWATHFGQVAMQLQLVQVCFQTLFMAKLLCDGLNNHNHTQPHTVKPDVTEIDQTLSPVTVYVLRQPENVHTTLTLRVFRAYASSDCAVC